MPCGGREVSSCERVHHWCFIAASISLEHFRARHPHQCITLKYLLSSSSLIHQLTRSFSKCAAALPRTAGPPPSRRL